MLIFNVLPSHSQRATSGVGVPRMISLHTIAVIQPVITITHLEMLVRLAINIRGILARGMIAFMTLLQTHPAKHVIIGEP